MTSFLLEVVERYGVTPSGQVTLFHVTVYPPEIPVVTIKVTLLPAFKAGVGRLIVTEPAVSVTRCIDPEAGSIE
jgi:hypothetical protein